MLPRRRAADVASSQNDGQPVDDAPEIGDAGERGERGERGSAGHEVHGSDARPNAQS